MSRSADSIRSDGRLVWKRQLTVPAASLIGALCVSIHVFCYSNQAAGQLPQTRLHSLFPSGGQVGTSFEVKVTGGADLEAIDQMIFSAEGIAAVPKTTEPDGGGQPVKNTFVVTIANDVPLGIHDVRVAGIYGASNPRSFMVGDRPEVSEEEPNNNAEQATDIQLNRLVNGRSNQTADVDYYRFEGTKGQRVIVECHAERIDSRMNPIIEAYDAEGNRLALSQHIDGVDALVDLGLPEDGEYYLKVYDGVFGGGSEYGYRLAVHTGPYIDFVLPAGGEPNSKTEFMIFGRNLPDGEPAGEELDGRPLQKQVVQVTLPSRHANSLLLENLSPVRSVSEFHAYRIKGGNGFSNVVPVFFSNSRVALEQEPNDSAEETQPIETPVEVTGRFQDLGDVDYFQFQARANEVLWIEVFGHRDGRAVDPVFSLDQVLVDKQGKETGTKRIANQDDDGKNLFASHFDTLSDDPQYKFEVPEDGTYRIGIHDRYSASRGNPRLIYRLAIQPSQPDFRLVAVPLAPLDGNNNNTASPWPVGLRKGDNFSIRILAFRRHGFDEAIDVFAEGLPSGVTTHGTVIGSGQTSGLLTFASSEDAANSYAQVRIFGRARSVQEYEDGTRKEIILTRPARAGSIVWNGDQNAPAVSRVSRELGLSVQDELAPFQLTTDMSRITVNRGRQILIPLRITRRAGFDDKVSLTFDGQPKNVQVENKSIEKGIGESHLRVFVSTKAPLGTYGIVLKSKGQVSYRRYSEDVERAKTLLASAADRVNSTQEKLAKVVAARDSVLEQLEKDNTALSSAASAIESAAKQLADENVGSEADVNKAIARLKEKEKELAAAVSAKVATLDKSRQASAAVQSAEEENKKALAAKEEAEKNLKDANDKNKPKNINIYPRSTPIIVKIVEHPATLNVSVPNNGRVKRGESIELKVAVKRVNGFKGPVRLTLPSPPNIEGLAATSATIAADQSEGILKISVAEDANEGDVKNLVVRAEMDYQGKAAVDQPVTLKIAK